MTVRAYPETALSALTNTGLDVVRGAQGLSRTHKFGRNESIGTGFEPISIGGVYLTPTATVSLEFVSNAAGDALNGAGMHELTVVGLDGSWNEQTVVTAAHATDGTTAVAISGSWFRVYRAYVSSSGTYGTTATGSHSGDITIRVASAGATYATITDTNYARGQSQIGCYTVPNGKTAYISDISITVDASQEVDVLLLQRPSANDVSSSYAGTMRTVLESLGLKSPLRITPRTPYGPFVGPCDLIFLAKAAATGTAEVDFEVILLDT